MKKFSKVIVIMIWCFIPQHILKASLPDEGNMVKPRALVRVTLGAPPPSCTRFGICQVEVLPGILRPSPGIVIAECEADVSGTALQFSIDLLTGADAETIYKYFNTGFFITETDFVISPDVAKTLQIREGLVIPAGRWEIKRLSGMITFVTDLR
jgi:hypothetical protein